MGRRFKTTLGAAITWRKLSKEYSFAQWLFAFLAFAASVSGLEPLRGLSGEPRSHVKAPLWPVKSSKTTASRRSSFPFS